jgi:hypothetical protein
MMFVAGEKSSTDQELLGRGVKRGRPIQKSQMVDITELLGLPQRQAAEVLGISESMLCKRYKERTKRKWPFRYLGKLEKKIAVKEAQLSRDGSLSVLEQSALDSLLKERAECLMPVSIRITDVDEKKPQRNTEPKGKKKLLKRDHKNQRDDEDEDEDGYDYDEEEFPVQLSFNPASVLMALADIAELS